MTHHEMEREQAALLFGGSAGLELARGVARVLGWKIGGLTVSRFPDGEVHVGIEERVREREIIFVQSTSAPVNDNLVELLAFADTCRRAGTRRLIAVVPYFGYARADRRAGRREPITASLVTELLQAAGVDHVVTVDLHSPPIEGFFRIGVENIDATGVLCDALRDTVVPDTVVVSPDVGRLHAALEFGRRLSCPVAVLHKARLSGEDVAIRDILGDVRDRPCLIIDDMISTGRTLAAAAAALEKAGARAEFRVAATHAVFAPGAEAVLSAVNLRDVIVTDTVPRQVWQATRVVSVAPLIADAVQRLLAGDSRDEHRRSTR